MSLRISFPDGLILFGGILGATPVGWWFGGLYGALMAAHVAIMVGLLLDLTGRRLCLAGVMLFIVWWPGLVGSVVLGVERPHKLRSGRLRPSAGAS